MAKSRSRRGHDDDNDKTPPPSPTPMAPSGDDDDGHGGGGGAGETEAAPWDRAQGVKAGVPAVSEIPWSDPEITVASSATEGPDDGFRTPAADTRPPGYAGGSDETATAPVHKPPWSRRITGAFSSVFRWWFRFRWLGYALLLVVLLPPLLMLQILATPYLLGEQAPYHITKAWLYQANSAAQLGQSEFAATQASVLATDYADANLLFHLLAAPFTLGWEPPEPRLASVTHTFGAVAVINEGGTLADSATWRIVVDGESQQQQVLGTFTLRGQSLAEERARDVERTLARMQIRLDPGGTLVTGRVTRDAAFAEAPLRSGLVLATSEGEAAGTLLSLETGYLQFDEEASPAEAGALLTLLHRRHGAPLGRLTLGALRNDDSESHGPFPFLVHHLRGGEPQLEGAGQLGVADFRGHVDPQVHDTHEWQRFVASLDGAPAPTGFAAAAHERAWPLISATDSLESRGKLAAAFFLALFVLTLVYVLRENGVRYSLVFAALLCLGGAVFMPRLFALEPFLFGMTLVLLAFHFALKSHRIWLIGLGVVAALSVGAPWLVALFAVVLLVWLVQWLTRDHLWHELALPSWAGLLLGMVVGVFLLHPQSGQLPAVHATQLAPWFAAVGLGESAVASLGQSLGLSALAHAQSVPDAATQGHAAPSTQMILHELWMLWLPVLLAVFGYLARGIRPSAAALMAFTLSALGGVVVLVTLEALPFVVPFVVLFLGLAALDHWQSLGWDVNRRGVPGLPAPTPDDLRPPPVRFLVYRPVRALALMGPLLVGGAVLVVLGAQQGLRALDEAAQPAPATDVALWMRAHVPPEANVFTTGWKEFPALFYAQPQGRYLVSHGPSYLYFYAPEGREPGEIHALWRDLRSGEAVLHDKANEHHLTWHEALRDIFESDYILVDKQAAAGLNELLQTAPHIARRVYEDRRYALYHLIVEVSE